MRKSSLLFVFFMLASFIPAKALELPLMDKPKIRVSVTPGETVYGDIALESRSGSPRSMRCYLEDWRYTAGGDGAKDFSAPNTLASSSASWISFSPAEFTVPAYGRKKVSYSIKVPPQAQGGYYAVLFFESVFQEGGASGEDEMGAGLGVNIRVGTLFYVEAKGTVNRRVLLENLNLAQDRAGGLSIQLDFSNSGNVDLTAATTYHMMDRGGLILARGEFNGAYTLPGDMVRLSASWDESLPAGNYTLVITSDVGKGLEDTNSGRGPVIVKEAAVAIGGGGEVVSVGALR